MHQTVPRLFLQGTKDLLFIVAVPSASGLREWLQNAVRPLPHAFQVDWISHPAGPVRSSPPSFMCIY